MGKKIRRNDPCPCGSGKKYKRCCMLRQTSSPSFSWVDKDDVHFVAPGTPPSPKQLKKMTEEYQRQIRNSPIWDEMIRKFGKEKAEELLKQYRVKPG